MKLQSAFTPLRIALIIFILIADILAIVSYVFTEASWSKMLGIFAAVFIMMLVFVQILELVWLYSFKKHQTDSLIKKSYQKAINIYMILFPIGFFMAYLALI